MPTYILELPEEGETKALLINLVGTLEKLSGIVVFDAIGVVLPVGDPAAELLRSLARDVIPERPAFAELVCVPAPEADHPLADEMVLEGNGEGVALPEISYPVVARMANAIEQGFKESTDAVLAEAPGWPYKSGNRGDIEIVVDYDGINTAIAKSMRAEPPSGKVTKKERKCPQCGRMYLPQGNRQTYCSKTCRIKASASGNGSGVKQGKLVG